MPAVAIASPAGVPGLRGSEDVLGILLSAIDSGQAVQFLHRSSRTAPYTTRTVEPWGVITEQGRWYLVGHDRDRNDTRTFRLSRIGAEVTPIGPPGAVTVPEGVDLRRIVVQTVGEAPTGVQAAVWVADGRATELRRAGKSLGPRQLAGRDGEVIELDIGSSDRLARDITGYGADAIVLEPQFLREDVLGPAARSSGEEGAHDSVSTRLVRLLNMVPYFQANPRITLAEAAAELGVSTEQLERTSTSCGCAVCPATTRVTSSTSSSPATPSR